MDEIAMSNNIDPVARGSGAPLAKHVERKFAERRCDALLKNNLSEVNKETEVLGFRV
jgi:hypothetical protein